MNGMNSGSESGTKRITVLKNRIQALTQNAVEKSES